MCITYTGADRNGAEFIGNKQTCSHADTQIYVLVICFLIIIIIKFISGSSAHITIKIEHRNTL